MSYLFIVLLFWKPIMYFGFYLKNKKESDLVSIKDWFNSFWMLLKP